MLTMTKKKKRTDQPVFDRLSPEVIEAIPEIRSSSQVAEFGEKRDQLQAQIKESEERLRNYQWRPGNDGDADEGARRAATAKTIGEAASQYLESGEMETFGGSEDAVKDVLRHRVMVLRAALEAHQERYGKIHQAAVQEHLAEVLPLAQEAAAEVVAAGRVFLEALLKQDELLSLCRRRGFRRENLNAPAADGFSDQMLARGQGESLEHYMQRLQQNWSITP